MTKNVFFRKNEKGQGIVEYALILAFVVLLAVSLSNGDALAGKVSKIIEAVEGLFV